MTATLYDALGVPPDASPDDIKAAHRAAAKRHHPDAGGDAEKFGQIQRAYDVLSDPDRRARYDATGDTDTMDPEARIDGMARDYIAHMLIATVQNEPGVHYDWLGHARSKAASDRQKMLKDRDTLKKKRGTAEKLASKFTAKGSHNIPRDVVATICRDIDRTIEDIGNRLKVLDRVDALLKDYEFEVESNPYLDPFSRQHAPSPDSFFNPFLNARRNT